MMLDRNRHLSNEELLLAAEGELGSWSVNARAHLSGCVHCKTRTAQLEDAIKKFSQTQRNSLESQLPSIAGPRAMLQARMAESTAHCTSVPLRFRIPSGFFAGAFRVAAIAAFLVVAGVFAFRHSDPQIASSADDGILPNRALTPGVVRQVSLEQVCTLPHEQVIADVSPSQRQKVLDEYGIPSSQADKYEIDYLIAPGLGGDDSIRNLWPEPYGTANWNAHVKDKLEERLHEMVCSRKIGLAAAQQAIASNWIAAYQKYVQPSTANAQSNKTSWLAAPAGSVIATNDIELRPSEL